MAPVSFVIRNCVKRRGGGQSDNRQKEAGRERERNPDGQSKASVREEKKENSGKTRLGAN